MNGSTNCGVPQKQTMGNLVSEILSKCYQIKNRERDLAERLFGIGENEGILSEEKEKRGIEQELFQCRNVLDIILERMEENIKNLD